MPIHGHLPGHYRECFANAVDDFYDWFYAQKAGAPPMAVFEIGYVPHEIPLARACGFVWCCTDIMPGSMFGLVREVAEALDLPLRSRTYAAAARIVAAALKARAST